MSPIEKTKKPVPPMTKQVKRNGKVVASIRKQESLNVTKTSRGRFPKSL